MSKFMFYDNFTDEYVSKKDPYAPPERYLLTFRHNLNFYEEVWNAKDGKRVGRLYTPEQYHDSKYHDMVLIDLQNKCDITTLAYWVIPAKKFDEYAKEFGVKVNEWK